MGCTEDVRCSLCGQQVAHTPDPLGRGCNHSCHTPGCLNRGRGLPKPAKVRNRQALVETLIARDGDGCFYCGLTLPYHHYTFDHFLPRAAGGTRELPNLRLACQRCNNLKADRLVPDGWQPRRSGSWQLPPLTFTVAAVWPRQAPCEAHGGGHDRG